MLLALLGVAFGACEIGAYDAYGGRVVLDGQTFRGYAGQAELERRDCRAEAVHYAGWRRARTMTTVWAVSGCVFWPLWLPLFSSIPNAQEARRSLVTELGRP